MNINGVTVLAQEAIITQSNFVTIAILIIVGVMFIAGIGFILTDLECKTAGWITLASSIIVLIMGILLGCGVFQKTSDRNEYKVLIDDSVPLSDIYDNYEIIEHEGLIWTLMDKEK